MPSDEYANVLGGGLRLKGGKVEKKKKKKIKRDQDQKVTSPGHDKPLERVSANDGKTETEKKFEEIQRKRLEKQLEGKAAKSYKEQVEEYNKYLGSLSEHHDMPKIGPG
ncbi:hypothetical protein V1514DRAFT_341900 [Lipomyces japonicus]|uniref:uncharacterized protein n=1 Tax=Lipomyces japonicus TaxID=56871 RepID=UPI0034CE562A